MSAIVLGMHRSGTSAATRMLSLLGLPVGRPDDLSRDRRGNERGVWESASLVRFNDELLRRAGGAWWCPPDPDTDWAELVEERGERACETFRAAHPGPSWVWKDPRTCLTARFWLRALDVRPDAVLVLRDPAAVSASLRRRNRFSDPAGLALWERYLREALRAVVGLRLLVTRYADLTGDPATWCLRASDFLAGSGTRVTPARALRAVGYIDPVERATTSRVALSAQQEDLWSVLTGLVGVHERFVAPPLGPETPSTATFFAAHRGRLTARGPAAGHPVATTRSAVPLFAHPARDAPEPPSASVVVISRDEGPMLRATVDRLMATLPADAEVVVVDDQSSDNSADGLDKMPRVRLTRPAEPLGIARARNAGAALARGRLLVFSDAHVDPRPGWFEALSRELADPAVGAVNPAVGHLDDCRHLVHGLTFDAANLNVTWVRHPGRTEAFDVPLLTGCFVGLRREVFDAVGGFDAGMTGYGAEDLELCLRLWRTGYRCRSVPAAVVGHRFRSGRPVDRVGFLHNVLRLATGHFEPSRLAQVVVALRADPAFAAAAARLLAGDIGSRRALTDALCWHDDASFFQRFGPACLA